MIVCVALVAAASVVFAEDGEDKGRFWYIKGSFGMAGHDLGELETALRAEKEDWASQGIDVSTYSRDFDNVWDYRVEVGALIFKNFTLGAAFSYQPRTDDQEIAGITPDDQIRLSETIGLDYYAFLGVLQFRIPGTHQFFVGANAGYGTGKFEQSTTATSTAVPDWGVTASGKFDGSNFVYGFSGGYGYQFLNGVLLYVEMGYEFRDLGTFDGSITSTNIDIVPEQSGTYNVDGEDVNFDFSGPFLAIGFGFAGPY
jgi:opacity protein-like surface antigen